MSRSAQIVVEIDHSNDAAYIRFTDKSVASTVEVNQCINIDLDEHRMVVGIEVLELAAELPFQMLIEHYHVPSDQVELLRRLRPSVSGSIHTDLPSYSHADLSPTAAAPSK